MTIYGSVNEVSPINWMRLNAHGPYSMGVWRGENSVEVGDQESMAGRAEIILSELRRCILERFSLEEIRELSIVDIGCNDGWLLHNLSDLPFAAMTGVEPREKNVRKGIVVREELKLTNSIEFIVGTIDAIKGRKFDIVVNTGVLYHVANINQFICSLFDVCGQYLFLESRTLNSDYISKKLIKQSELVDLPYKLGNASIGMSTHKFETDYSDGSSFVETVVSLPTPEAVIMYLKNAGFSNIQVELNPETFRKKLFRKDRPLDGICVSAEVVSDKSCLSMRSGENLTLDLVESLEEIYMRVMMPEKCLRLVEDTKFGSRLTLSISKIVTKFWLNPKYFHVVCFEKFLIKKLNLTPDQAMVFKDFKFNPRDKVKLERIKVSLSEGNVVQCQELVNSLLATPNADWRSTYRALFYGAKLASVMRDQVKVQEYVDLLRSCNPNWLNSSELIKSFNSKIY